MSATSERLELVERYEVLNIINDAIAHNALSYENCVNEIVESIARIPAADVRPVVFCKDCKHAHMTHDGLCKYCDMMDERGVDDALYLPGDWFCADGVKREES